MFLKIDQSQAIDYSIRIIILNFLNEMIFFRDITSIVYIGLHCCYGHHKACAIKWHFYCHNLAKLQFWFISNRKSFQ